MSIGSFGNIIFTASAEQMRTFDELQRQNSARYVEHEVIGKKPLLEFKGPGLEELSFKIQLMSYYGVDPDAELRALQEMRDRGEAAQLIFGETKIGKFAIQSVSATEGPRDKSGAASWIEINLTLKEYVEHE